MKNLYEVKRRTTKVLVNLVSQFSISLNISQTFSEIIALKGKGVQLTNGKIIPDTPHKGENVTTLQ